MTVLTSLLWFSVFCGLASMATVEVAKRLTGLRGLYQERQVRLWLTERATGGDPTALSEQLDSVLGLTRAAAGYPAKRRALYNLPVGQLVAQIGIAAERVLSNPASDRRLVSALIGEAAMPPSPPTPPTANAPDTAKASIQEDTAARERARRAYESQLLRTALDQLQISVSGRWRTWVQWTAVALSGAYGIALGYLMNLAGRSVYVLAAIFIGGFFSWLAKDVSGGLERWRRQ
jgi:hypothetical protein